MSNNYQEMVDATSSVNPEGGGHILLPHEVLTVERIGYHLDVNSKKRVLYELGQLLAFGQPELSADVVVDCLRAREKIGSTGLGQGIGLPHARMASLQNAVGAFVLLQKGVDFDSIIDSQPVDLIFALLVPEAATQMHLELLAKLAGMFNRAEFGEELRQAKNAANLLEIFTYTKPYI